MSQLESDQDSRGREMRVAPSVGSASVTYALGGGTPRPAAPEVAVEVAVNVVYGTVPYAVMMMTPSDLEDFAVGFSLTEGVIGRPEDIRRVVVEEAEAGGGLRLLVDLVPERLHGFLSRRRSMAGRTSCGVCGIEDLADLPRAALAGADRVAASRVTLDAVASALRGIEANQPLNAVTRAVHAAGWADLDGTVRCVREDVGRHNALDKLIGAASRAGHDPAGGFVVVTSRCSYEMVEKAAAFGARVLVAVSAPTSLGIERAREHGMTLAGVARRDAVTVYAGEAIGAGEGG